MEDGDIRLTQMLEAILLSTRRVHQENCDLNIHCNENLQSYKTIVI